MPALLDAVVATLLGSCVFLVHDVGYLLHHPYWLDESWVADSTRAPLTSVPFMTSSSPLGWTYLLRVAVVGGEQRARLVPLAFAGLAVGLAYYLGRELRPGNILTGLLCGTAVLLVPAMLVRDDLKQYTAEAAATLLLVLLLARLETEWSRSRLFALVVGCVVALVFASTVLFTATAVFVSLVLVAAVRAEWRRLRDAAVGAAIAAAGMGVVYLVLLRPHRTAMLTAYWRHFYLPTNAGAGGLVDFVRLHGGDLAPYVGFRHWGITLVLFVAGTWTLWRWHRQELAIVVPLLALFVSVASARRLYPFLDLRTSTFWIVVVAVVMAIGVAGVVELASTASRPFGLALLAAAVVAGEPARLDLAHASSSSLIAFLYLLTFGSLIGFTAYVYLLAHTTAAKASTYAYVNPVVAVLLGWAIGHEPVTSRTVLAAAVILGGVAIITITRDAVPVTRTDR